MQAFRVMLDPVLDELGLQLWVDTDIRTGDQWNAAIERAIARSGAALLLVSPRFLASSYIHDHELPALRAHGVRLAPVLVGSSFYEWVDDLAAAQWLHDPDGDGALNLVVDHPGERDRRIWQACRNLLTILPSPAATAALPASPQRADPVRKIGVTDVEGLLSKVPAPPPGYVARDELTELIEAVCAGRTGAVGVTGTSLGLHGQGGIGKSVLAVGLARDRVVRSRFPDGVFWVTLGETGDILAAQLDLLSRIDPTAPSPRTPVEADRLLRDRLADRRVLLIVDDVWSDAAAHAFRLTGPHGRVLYTSRDPRVFTGLAREPSRLKS
jgi:hypothetical protein